VPNAERYRRIKERKRWKELAGPRLGASRIASNNDDLGANLDAAYDFRGLTVEPGGDLSGPKNWGQAGGKGMAEEADRRRRRIRSFAGALWGDTSQLETLKELAEKSGETVSERTLRRYFKKLP
jgi:hypothetical protein